MPGNSSEVAATNDGEGSIAATADAPRRSTRTVVRTPGPQPTSSTVPGGVEVGGVEELGGERVRTTGP